MIWDNNIVSCWWVLLFVPCSSQSWGRLHHNQQVAGSLGEDQLQLGLFVALHVDPGGPHHIPQSRFQLNSALIWKLDSRWEESGFQTCQRCHIFIPSPDRSDLFRYNGNIKEKVSSTAFHKCASFVGIEQNVRILHFFKTYWRNKVCYLHYKLKTVVFVQTLVWTRKVN